MWTNANTDNKRPIFVKFSGENRVDPTMSTDQWGKISWSGRYLRISPKLKEKTLVEGAESLAKNKRYPTHCFYKKTKWNKSKDYNY